MGFAQIIPSERIDGILRIVPQQFSDERGSFVETWRQEWTPHAPPFVQHNLSRRRGGCVVGLHFHRNQADYWVLTEGRITVGLADLRRSSPTFRSAESFVLEPGIGVYIPKGVAHGFAALTDIAMTYSVDQYYDPADELGVAWNDPAFAIDWQLTDPLVSERDRTNPFFADIPEAELPN